MSHLALQAGQQNDNTGLAAGRGCQPPQLASTPWRPVHLLNRNLGRTS
jgi:hypothetical protein